MKKVIVILTVVIALAVTASSALASWEEGPGTNWWYTDASYGDYQNTVPLVIKLDGNPASGQSFNVGDTVNITVDLHAVAVSCGGDGNGAYTEWLLQANGPSGNLATTDWNYDSSSGCAEIDTNTTLVLAYNLTTPGTHTIYMNSYAAVSQYWADVDNDTEEAWLTFEVSNAAPDNKDSCKKGAWATFVSPSFKNQGDCVSYVQSNENAEGNRKDN